MPTKAARSGFSRIAASAAPNGEPQQRDRDRDEREREVEVAGRRQHVVGRAHRQAVVAAGDAVPAEGHAPHQLGKRHRQDREVEAAEADAEEADHEADRARHQRRQEHPDDDVDAEPVRQQRHRIGADAVVGGMAERQHAGLAEQQIVARGEQRHDQEVDHQEDEARIDEPGRRDEQGEQDAPSGELEDHMALRHGFLLPVTAARSSGPAAAPAAPGRAR
jgi:hypothetical protein